MLRGASEKISLEAADQTSKQSSTSSLITLDQRGSADDIFISISGMIGAGKSTLATALATELGLPIFYEPVADNEYLQDFVSISRIDCTDILFMFFSQWCNGPLA